MTENKTIGVYYVDTTDLDGWTDETLAGALRGPLGEFGIDIEIGNSIINPVFFDVGVNKEDALRDQVKYIVDKVVSN
jgi:hypothetical protein